MDTQLYRDPTTEELDLAVETLKLLADRTRLRIVWALLHGEHSVNELADHVDMSPAGASQHLAKLRLARLVTVRRQGTKAFYSAESEHVRKLAEQALFHADHVVGGSAHHDGRNEATRAPHKRA